MENDGRSTVTAIEVQRHDPERRAIFLDGHFALGVHAEVVERTGLCVGQRLELAELQALARTEERRAARDAAFRFLGYRDRSAKEIERRLLRKGFAAEIVAEVLELLEDRQVVDDARFSRSWVASRSEGAAMGPERLSAELRFRGVAPDVVREAVAAIDPETELALARRAARKKVSSLDARDPAARRRLAAALRRRGFSWDVIRRTCGELLQEPNDES